MEAYLTSSRASLVVMGSVHLTLSTAIGSVVLTLLRRLSLPMLVVTANSGGQCPAPDASGCCC
jgi:nucleotide-binding universal stress UspA family protein